MKDSATKSQYFANPNKYKYIGCYDRDTIETIIAMQYQRKYDLHIVACSYHAFVPATCRAYKLFVELPST